MTVNNLGWCKPVAVFDYVFVFSEGRLITIFDHDVEVILDRDDLVQIAKELDPDFDGYKYKDAVQCIAEHSTELSCKDCPAVFDCECWSTVDINPTLYDNEVWKD